MECISNAVHWGVVSFHRGCGVFPWGVWCLSIAVGLVNKKEHVMACVDTCGCKIGA